MHAAHRTMLANILLILSRLLRPAQSQDLSSSEVWFYVSTYSHHDSSLSRGIVQPFLSEIVQCKNWNPLLPFSRYGNLDPSVDSVPVLPGRPLSWGTKIHGYSVPLLPFPGLTWAPPVFEVWKLFWKKFQVFHFFGLFPFFWTLGNCTMQKLESTPPFFEVRKSRPFRWFRSRSP